METKYKIGDIAYHVKDYQVVKVLILESTVKTDTGGSHVSYLIASYKEPSNTRKQQNSIEAMLVGDLETAKTSATLNWEKIDKAVREGMANLKEEDYDPILEPKESE